MSYRGTLYCLMRGVLAIVVVVITGLSVYGGMLVRSGYPPPVAFAAALGAVVFHSWGVYRCWSMEVSGHVDGADALFVFAFFSLLFGGMLPVLEAAGWPGFDKAHSKLFMTLSFLYGGASCWVTSPRGYWRCLGEDAEEDAGKRRRDRGGRGYWE